MTTDPKTIISSVEAALLAAMDRRFVEERASMARTMLEEIDALRGVVEQLPEVLPMLAAAGQNPPAFCQAGVFDLVAPARCIGDPHHPYHPVVDKLRLVYPPNGWQFEVQTAPYQSATAAKVVRALSGTGLQDGKKYRYVIIAWPQDDESKGG